MTFTDPVLDGQTILVDWGDGETSTIQYPDQEQPPPPEREMFAFLHSPQLITFTESFTHQYLDDNPTATLADDYIVIVIVIVTVSDNDTYTATTTTTVTVRP